MATHVVKSGRAVALPRERPQHGRGNRAERAPMEIWQWVVSVALPALAGLGGVLLGARMSERRDRAQRRAAFIERQLRELYSPLPGLRAEIQALTELREDAAGGAAGTTWEDLISKAQQRGGDDHQKRISEVQRVREERWPAFEAQIKFDNEQFKNHFLPSYRQMLKTLRDNLWLAEPCTREHFEELTRYVAIWERHLAETIVPEAIAALGHTEAKLQPFYQNLIAVHDRLGGELAAGEPVRKK